MRLTYSIIICFIFLSCQKDKEDTTVEGRVINDITGQPMANFQINIMERESKSFEGGTSSLVSRVYSDGNGWFETKFDSRRRYKFSYEIAPVFDDQMYVKAYTDSKMLNDDIEKRMNNYFDVKIAPAGSLTVALSPPPPYSGSDSIHAKFYHKNWIVPDMIELSDKNVNPDGTIRAGEQMMGQYIVNISKFKSGVYSTQTDTFYLNWNEHKLYTINF